MKPDAPVNTSGKQQLRDWFLGEDNAVEMVCLLQRVVSVWDDIIDGDNPSDSEVNEVLTKLLVDLPLNDFFINNRHTFVPLFYNGIANWMVSTRIEREKISDLAEQAHVLRYSIADVVLTTAAILGGLHHATEIGPAVRRFVMKDTLDSYKKEHFGG